MMSKKYSLLFAFIHGVFYDSDIRADDRARITLSDFPAEIDCR